MRFHVGYTVYAKRPNRSGGFEYSSVGCVWPKVEPCENHQAYCQDSAKERGDTKVEYVIAAVSVLSDATVRDTVWFEENRERDERRAKETPE